MTSSRSVPSYFARLLQFVLNLSTLFITARLINYGTVRYSKYLYQYGTVLLYLLDDSSLEMIIRFCSVCFTVLVLCAVVLITTQ
jgi:hypothetical protein